MQRGKWRLANDGWCHNSVAGASCRGLNEHTNFERFWTAALTLFKIATNDNWTDVMVACMIKVSSTGRLCWCGFMH
jgi:hypothetical protein